jgi:GDP-L-fucose synthase
MDRESRIYVAGNSTFLGEAIRRAIARSFGAATGSGDPDFADPSAVDRFFAETRPEFVFVAAGRTAGIAGNQQAPADLMLDNLLVASHLLPAARRYGVKKLLYLSSSCTYPRLAPQPMAPESLWTGPLEPTSASYAVAKLAGMSLCDAFRRQFNAPFISAIAGDAYGPGDDFSPEHSHVVASLLRRARAAVQNQQPFLEIWGTGTPRRDFIFIDDLADACVFAMNAYDGAAPINLGSGRETSIRELAEAIGEVAGFTGELRFDSSKPDGMPRKSLDSTVLSALGWRPRYTLRQGLDETYRSMVR